MPVGFAIPNFLRRFHNVTNKDQVSTSNCKEKGKALQVGSSVATCVRKNYLANLPSGIIELILDILTPSGFTDLLALRLVCNKLN